MADNMFKLYDCDIGIVFNGIRYQFDDVVEVQVEDPERNRLTRGANATNKRGIVYKDGLKDPKKWTIPIMQMSKDLLAVMVNAFEQQARLDVYCVARSDGSSKWMRQAIMSNRPQQLKLDDTADSLNVSLEFESFDVEEVRK